MTINVDTNFFLLATSLFSLLIFFIVTVERERRIKMHKERDQILEKKRWDDLERDQQRTISQLQHQLTDNQIELKKLQGSLDAHQKKEKTLLVNIAVKDEQLTALPGFKEQMLEREQKLQRLQQRDSQLSSEVAQLRVQLSNEKQQAGEKIALLNNTKEQLKLEFENVANKIFEEKGKKFSDQNQVNISTILSPLKDQLKDFKAKVEDVYVKESKDRVSLHTEILTLKSLNQKISEDAINLTRALKGENKTQGNWGEMILERVLEESGLKKGREYESQSSFNTNAGKRQQPDVVVHLPDGKDVVIDSKVSLTAYERFCSSEDDGEKVVAIKEHVQSIKSHVKGLSEKDYSALTELRSLDFVLLFIPIEAAFLYAVDAEPELFTKAFERNIMIVCPSTLLVTLKTIQNNWRYEYQNQNATKIADEAGGIYDQLAILVSSLDDLGLKITKVQQAFDTSKKRLVTGRGNLVRRVESLKTLGARTKKQLDKNLLEEAVADESNQGNKSTATHTAQSSAKKKSDHSEALTQATCVVAGSTSIINKEHTTSDNVDPNKIDTPTAEDALHITE